MNLQEIDVRVDHDEEARLSKAARTTVRFLRKQAEVLVGPGNKEELVRTIWKMYWRLHKSGMLAASGRTRQILRDRFPIWSSLEVAPKWAL